MNQLEQGGFSEKELPYSIEAEQSILGAILVNSDVLPTVVDLISPECFYNEQHRQLYGIMLRLFTSGSQADIVVVLNEALQARIFENAQEGRKYLAALVDQMPSVSNVASYCKIVAEKYYIRSAGILPVEGIVAGAGDGGCHVLILVLILHHAENGGQYNCNQQQNAADQFKNIHICFSSCIRLDLVFMHSTDAG